VAYCKKVVSAATNIVEKVRKNNIEATLTINSNKIETNSNVK